MQVSPGLSLWHQNAGQSASHWLEEIKSHWPDGVWKICQTESIAQRELVCYCNVRLQVYVRIKQTQFSEAKQQKLWRSFVEMMWLERWNWEHQHCYTYFRAVQEPRRQEGMWIAWLGWLLLSCASMEDHLQAYYKSLFQWSFSLGMHQKEWVLTLLFY